MYFLYQCRLFWLYGLNLHSSNYQYRLVNYDLGAFLQAKSIYLFTEN